MERGMTVGELIELLGAHPPDLRVVVQGYEGGYDDLTPPAVLSLRLALDVDDRDYMGDHEDARYVSSSHSASPSDIVDAVALHRMSH